MTAQFWVLIVVFVAVIAVAFLFMAIRRGTGARHGNNATHPEPGGDATVTNPFHPPGSGQAHPAATHDHAGDSGGSDGGADGGGD